jgi:arginine deiminase
MQAYHWAMHRQDHVQRHTVIYENDGVEVARYSVSAASEREAEAQTTKLFFEGHPEFDELAILPGLTFRIEGGDTIA